MPADVQAYRTLPVVITVLLNPTDKIPTACTNCESDKLSWTLHVQGDTHPHPVAVLGCVDCSETLMVRDVGESPIRNAGQPIDTTLEG
jgi:hypothetical protein